MPRYELCYACGEDQGMDTKKGACTECGAYWALITTKAASDIHDERARQKSKEGWTVEHDDEHTDGSLADAAACYALTGLAMVARFQRNADGGQLIGHCPSLWPCSWHPKWWKPKDRRRNLVRAGALIIAEIERLDRLAKKSLF